MTTTTAVISATYDLSAADKAIVDRLLNSNGALSDVLPPEDDPDKLWEILAACCRSMLVARREISTLKPLIGKILLRFQANPELYKSRGYKTFDDFLTNAAPFGLVRSEAYASKRLAAKWPSLTVEQVKKITYSKLSELSRFTSEEDPKANEWLEIAQRNDLDGLRDVIANRGIAAKADMEFANITITVKRSVRDQWVELIANPRVIATVGSESPAAIFEALLGESSSWLLAGDPEYRPTGLA